MTDLLPCPFCGGEAEIDTRQTFRHYRTGEPLEQVSVYCVDCSADISHYPGDLDCDREGTIEICIEAWNTRPASTEPADALVEDLMSAPYEWHGPFGKEKHRIIPPALFDRILAALTRTDALAEAREADAATITALRQRVAELEGAVLVEREACAKVMENLCFFTPIEELMGMTKQQMSVRTCREGAKEIRNRSNDHAD